MPLHDHIRVIHQVPYIDFNFDTDPDSQNGKLPCVAMDKTLPYRWMNVACDDYFLPFCSMATFNETPTKADPPIMAKETSCDTNDDIDWVQNSKDPNREFCYYFSDEKLIWLNARKRCEDIGGKLTSISKKAENKFISKTMEEESWIGMFMHYGDYEWVDGSESKFYNWAYGGTDILLRDASFANKDT